MSKRRRSPGLELRLNRPSSPVPIANSSSAESPEFTSSSSSISYSSKMTIVEGSGVLSPEAEDIVKHASAPETKAMALVGCPRCFMYVMLSEVDPKCPKCKSNVFLYFFR